jgi:NTP pyrophosphatase (non-canonical NTP hydrolase)
VELDGYQDRAMDTALGIATGEDGITYTALKLNGEAGEVAEVVGKWMRGDFGDYDSRWMPLSERIKLAKELGDVLWYLAVLANRLGFPLSTIAQDNLTKLKDRQERGVLQGNGSDR